MNRHSLRSIFHTRGVALISVMLLLAFLVTIIAYMLESQYLVIRQTSLQSVNESAYLENSYVESWAIASLTKEALDGKSIKESYQIDFLDEFWSQEGLSKDVGGLRLESQVTDLQGRFNVNNLEGGKTGQWYLIFNRLLQALDIPPTITDAIVDWIDSDQNPAGINGAEDQTYMSEVPARRAANQRMRSVEELLLVKGVTPEIYKVLLPHVTVIDKNDLKINVNTATLPVLQALLTNPGSAESFLGQRQSGFDSVEEIIQLPEFAGTGTSLQPIIDVKSNYFELKVTTASEKNKKTYFSGIQREVIDDKLEFTFIYRKRST